MARALKITFDAGGIQRTGECGLAAEHSVCAASSPSYTLSHSQRLRVTVLTFSLRVASDWKIFIWSRRLRRWPPIVVGVFGTGTPRLWDGKYLSRGTLTPFHKKATSRTPDGKMPGESRCSPREIQNFLNRISGPLLDRIDIHVEVPAVKFREITAERTGETSAQIRGRVVTARRRQQERFAGKRSVTCNARMAQRLVRKMLRAAGWMEEKLKHRPKGDIKKARMSAPLRSETTMTWLWIAKRLEMEHCRLTNRAQ